MSGRELLEAQEQLYEFQNKIDRLREALEKLVHLHNCEQEGIESGKPTPGQWIEAVKNAEDALK